MTKHARARLKNRLSICSGDTVARALNDARWYPAPGGPNHFRALVLAPSRFVVVASVEPPLLHVLTAYAPGPATRRDLERMCGIEGFVRVRTPPRAALANSCSAS